LETLLDLRTEIGLGIDRYLLSSHSLRDFYGRFAPAVNRNVIGPQLERVEEFLALIDAQVIDVSAGPGPKVDHDKGWIVSPRGWVAEPLRPSHLVIGRATYPAPDHPDHALLQTLCDSGVTTWNGAFDVPGISVDARLRVIRRDGSAHSRIWAVGVLIEGSKYYNNYVPVRSTVRSSAFSETDLIVDQIMAG
jgi:hypothetical protein